MTISFLDTPVSQRSRFSPTMDAFPDTLPVLDEEQNPHDFALIHPEMMTTYSNESDPQNINNLSNKKRVTFSLDNNVTQDGPSIPSKEGIVEQNEDEEVPLNISTPPLGVDDDDFDKQSDSNCEPIPSDEQKLSSHSHSASLERMLEQDPSLLETPSERAFLQQLSNMALEETNVCVLYHLYSLFISYARYINMIPCKYVYHHNDCFDVLANYTHSITTSY